MFINYHNTKCCKQKRIKSVFGVNINSQEKTSADQFITSINPRRVKNFYLHPPVAYKYLKHFPAQEKFKKEKKKRKCFWSKHLLSLFYTQALCFWTHPALFPYWRNGLLASGLMPKSLLTRILWTISEFLLHLVFVWPPLFGLLRKIWTAHENTCLLPNFSLWKILMIQGVHFEFLSSFRFSVEAKRPAWPF